MVGLLSRLIRMVALPTTAPGPVDETGAGMLAG
jgi:hypothetical protein